MQLEDLLRDYARENGDLETETVLNDDIVEDGNVLGATEITVVTDNTMSTLEEALEKTSDQVERMKNNDTAAEKVAEAVDGLEALEARLVSMALEGRKLDSTAMEFFNASVVATLESRMIPVEFYLDSVKDMKASFESSNLEDYTSEAQEMIAGGKEEGKGKPGILSRLYNLLKTIGAAIVRGFSEFTASLSTSAAAIKTSGEKLKRVGGKLTGSAKEGKISSPIGAPVAAVEKANSAYTQVSALQSKLGAAVDSLTAALNGGTGSAGTAVAATEIDLGAAKLKYTPGAGEGAATLGGGKFTATKSGESAQIDPLTPAQISELGTKLIATAAAMSKLATDAKAVSAKTDSVMKAAEKQASKDANLSDEQRKNAAASIKTAQAAIKGTKGLLPAYVQQLGAIARAAYKVGISSASKYSGSAAESTGAPPAAPKQIGSDK